nr:MAG TPA: hypothetical protein [Caudoviricetes sp.]
MIALIIAFHIVDSIRIFKKYLYRDYNTFIA